MVNGWRYASRTINDSVSAALECLHRRLQVVERCFVRGIRITRSKGIDDCAVALVRFAEQARLPEGNANVHHGGILQ